MIREQATDMLKEDQITLDRKWRKQNADRLIAWELFRRYILHSTSVPMTNEELCDTIGVSNSYTIRLLNTIRERLNPDDAGK